MRIAYFHQHFSTPAGSTGIRSYVMARRLLQRGHEVTMICGSYKGGVTGLVGPFVRGRREGIVDGIHVIELDLRYGNEQSLLRRSWIFLNYALTGMIEACRRRYDLVFATTTPLTAALPGIAGHWLARKPFVFEVRDLWPELPRAMQVIRNPAILAALSVLEWLGYKSAIRLVALSPGIAEGIARHGIAANRIITIPNGCELNLFRPGATPWRPPGVAQSDLMAVFSGTHGIANGLDAVIDAGAELKKRGRSDIKLILIGQGMLKPKLMQRARELALDNVVFCDPVPKANLSGLLAAADVGMQVLANVPAFYRGTSPNKFFDFIASGLPVLCNYPGWIADLIMENDIGFAVAPENPGAFADALEQAGADRTRLAGMGQRARELAQSQFDLTELSLIFGEWLEGAVTSRKG